MDTYGHLFDGADQESAAKMEKLFGPDRKGGKDDAEGVAIGQTSRHAAHWKRGIEIAAKQVVFVDVDDTLVRTVGTKRIPMPRTVARVKQLHSEGAELYLWSSGSCRLALLSDELPLSI